MLGRIFAATMLIFLAIAALAFAPTIQFTEELDSGEPFYDHFDGTEVNTQKWVVQQNVNTSGHPAYGGSIAVADSHIFLTSDGTSFPCVYSATTPFPLAGDFALEFDLTYKRVTDWGSGFWISNGPFEPSGEELRANIFQLWADGQGLRVYLLGNSTYKLQGETSTHIFRLEYSGGVYILYMDGATIASASSQLRPDTIGFGHPPISYVPFSYAGCWTAFKIDSVRMLRAATISVFTSASSMYVGFMVDINGTLSDLEWEPICGATVVLSYLVTGVPTWNSITSVTTDSEGSYSATWIPAATGNFVVKAEWAGNETYAGTYDDKYLSVLRYTGNYFFAESNSTLSSLSFDSEVNEISFTVTGPSGTTGYVRVLISKVLLANISEMKVYVDGHQTEYGVTPTDDSWLLQFTYVHSTHDVMITIPESSSLVMLQLFMLTTLLVIIFYKRKHLLRFATPP